MNFKVGDKIEILKGCEYYFSAGDIAEITEIYHEDINTLIYARFANNNICCVYAKADGNIEDYIKLVED